MITDTPPFLHAGTTCTADNPDKYAEFHAWVRINGCACGCDATFECHHCHKQRRVSYYA